MLSILFIFHSFIFIYLQQKLLERVGVCNHQHFSMGSTILIEKHEESCAYASNFMALRINEHKWMKYGQDCSKHIIY